MPWSRASCLTVFFFFCLSPTFLLSSYQKKSLQNTSEKEVRFLMYLHVNILNVLEQHHLLSDLSNPPCLLIVPPAHLPACSSSCLLILLPTHLPACSSTCMLISFPAHPAACYCSSSCLLFFCLLIPLPAHLLACSFLSLIILPFSHLCLLFSFPACPPKSSCLLFLRQCLSICPLSTACSTSCLLSVLLIFLPAHHPA